MESLAVLPHPSSRRDEPVVQLLLADDDALTRSLLASRTHEAVEEVAVLEAEDGAEAIRLGLQQRSQIALIDAAMPRLGGIEVAIMLRDLRPRMRLALQTDDPQSHRDRARAQRLPLFDKLELDRTLGWLEVQVQACAEDLDQRRSLECCSCGYRIVRSRPPVRCPMCQTRHGWIPAPQWSFRNEF